MKNQEISIFCVPNIVICESDELKKLNLKFSAILPYSTSKANNGRTKLEDVAVGKVQDYMVEAEKRMVAELVKKKKLGQDSYLLKDGSLEYQKMSSRKPNSNYIANLPRVSPHAGCAIYQ